jgi:hypothetical protein
MARRIRVLIYDGPEEWITFTHSHEWVRQGRNEVGSDRSITSIEVDEAAFDKLTADSGENIKVYAVTDNEGKVNGIAIV